jgi:GntR family transcriptional regulator/MocR family aminotransferase
MFLAYVPVDAQGLDVEFARTKFPDSRMVYVTPSHQYPLGVTMSLTRRIELLEWAASREIWIVEDDYD